MRPHHAHPVAPPIALVLLALAGAPDAWSQEAPAKSELLLAPGWTGHVFVVDNARATTVAELYKLPDEERALAVTPSSYRIVIVGANDQPIAFTDIEVPPGERVIVDATRFQSIAAPAIPRAPPEAPPVRPLDRYPRGLAARPLTLTAHLVELGPLGYRGVWSASHYFNHFYFGDIRWSVTDRFEIRDLGVYYAIVPRHGAAPELGAGVALTGAGVSSSNGGMFMLASWLDVKQHIGRRAALAARLRYDLTLYTTGGFGPDHHLAPGLDLFIDVARIVSLVASGDYEWQRILSADMITPGETSERLGLLGGVHVAPFTWFDVRLSIGPSWARGGREPFTLTGRWQLEVRFRL